MATDNFTRSDEDPLSDSGNWASCSGAGTLQVVSNECANSSGTDATSYMRRSTSTELRSDITFSVSGGGNTDAGPCVCLDSSGNGYTFLNSASFQLYIFELPGFGLVVNPGGSNFTTGVVYSLRREGNDLVGYAAGVEVARGTDTSFMTGNPGEFQYQGVVRASLWTDAASAGATVYNRTIFDSSIFGNRVVR
jgi:hypothetical protein